MSRALVLVLPVYLLAMPVCGQTLAWGENAFGMPGLVDMPSAFPLADGDLALTWSHFADQTRTSLTFQITPRLLGTFRYSMLYGISPYADGEVWDYRFDRSFSLQYLLLEEQSSLPAVTIGLRDAVGTGMYSAEYVVGSKSFGDNLRVTAGIGWGRLGDEGASGNARSSDGESVQGGTLRWDDWFSGTPAMFGGIEWRPAPDWTVVAEYSSDEYPNESPYAFEQQSPFNFGVRYRIDDNWTIGANYLYGSELGVQLTWGINPKHPPYPSGLESAPPLVRASGSGSARKSGKSDTEAVVTRTRDALSALGIRLLGLSVQGSTARVDIQNDTYPIASEALGRTARVLTATLPPGIDEFEIVLVEVGMPITKATMHRQDLEELEFALDGAWAMRARTQLADPGPGLVPIPGAYPNLTWGIDPYLSPAYFDPDSPLRIEAGLNFTGEWQLAPGLVFSGILGVPLVGNLDDADRPSTSGLPHVRSDAWLYDKANAPLRRLTGNYYFRPGEDLFGRVSAGLLEPMFGGVSAELLWYPLGSRLALGAEVAQVVQRDYDQRFDFLDYETTTAFASAYWDMGGGYEAQLNVGQYLAGDQGATLKLERRFENGWRISAFATQTNVSYEDFGEGSFDKGIQLIIPVGWVSGKPTRDNATVTLRPVLRDGGAMLDVDGRLYETVRNGNATELVDGWGRFWR